jgi:hypothetical protein
VEISAKLQIKPGQRLATVTETDEAPDPARQISIDGTWSALRFRPA